MQQSTRWRSSPPGPRFPAVAVAFALVCAPAMTAAADVAVDAPDDSSAAVPIESDSRVAAFRPHWIEPRRGDGPSTLDTAPTRDWRSGSRIVVHALTDRARLAILVEGMLARLGAEAVERRVVDVAASTDQIRFFHAEDAAMATALAATLEPLFGVVRVRDLTFYRPLPESGALEVWLR